MVSSTKQDERYIEYDDLTKPERITNFVLLGLYSIQFICCLRVFWQHRNTNKTFSANWLIAILISSSLLLR